MRHPWLTVSKSPQSKQKYYNNNLCRMWWFFFSFGSAAACGIFVSQPRTEPMPSAVEVQSLNHWTTREVTGKDLKSGAHRLSKDEVEQRRELLCMSLIHWKISTTKGSPFWDFGFESSLSPNQKHTLFGNNIILKMIFFPFL